MNIEEVDFEPLIIQNILSQSEEFKEESFTLNCLDLDYEIEVDNEDTELNHDTEAITISFETIPKVEDSNHAVIFKEQQKELRIVLQRCDVDVGKYSKIISPTKQKSPMLRKWRLKASKHQSTKISLPMKKRKKRQAAPKSFTPKEDTSDSDVKQTLQKLKSEVSNKYGSNLKKFTKKREISKSDTAEENSSESESDQDDEHPQRQVKIEPKPNPYYKKKRRIKKNPTRKLKQNICTWCGLDCGKFFNLKVHQQSQSAVKDPTCNLCSKKFDYKCQLTKHYNLDHAGETKRYLCPECGKKFNSMYYVKRHLLTHTEILPYGCPECEKRFRRSDHVIAHMKVMHPKEFTHVCDICEEAFKDKFKLARHKMKKHSVEGLFKCPQCTKTLNSKAGLRRHIITHTETKKFICDRKRCGKAFLTHNEMARHKQRHSTERPFTCEFCMSTHKTKVDLRKHQDRSSCKHKLPFKCVICKKGYKVLDRLREHEMTHIGKHMFKCDNVNCRKFFKVQANLIAHKESAHGEKPEVVQIELQIDPLEMIKQCQPSVSLQKLQLGNDQYIQPKWFKYLNGYCYMKKCIVKNAWYWRCSELTTRTKCGATLIEDLTTGAMRRGLRKHNHPPDPKRKLSANSVPEEYEKTQTRAKNTSVDIISLDKITGESTDGFFDTKPKKKIIHRCQFCARIFSKKSILVNHIRIHTGEKPFSCPFCDKTFAAVGSLITHKRLHTQEKPYKCKECDFAACTSTQLKSHVFTHHTAYKPKPFKCNQCGKSFALNRFLNYHLKTHTGVKPYECEICHTRFTQSGGLLVHKRRHTNEKPHKCNLCEYASTNSSGLRRHVRLRHSNEKPYKCKKLFEEI